MPSQLSSGSVHHERFKHQNVVASISSHSSLSGHVEDLLFFQGRALSPHGTDRSYPKPEAVVHAMKVRCHHWCEFVGFVSSISENHRFDFQSSSYLTE
jgi:hypothetical protein